MGGACVDVAGEAVGGSERGVGDGRQRPFHPVLLAQVPGRSGAPGRVELTVASEVGTSVGPERSVQDDCLSEVVVRRGVERRVAGFAVIFTVQLLDVGDPVVRGAADGGQGGRAGLRVVVVALREDRVGVGAAEFSSRQHVDSVLIAEGPVEGEMAADHVAVAVGAVLGYAAVEVGRGTVVVAEPVLEGCVGVLVHHLVGGVVGEGVGCESDEVQRLGYPEVGLRPDGAVGVAGLAVVGVQFAEDAEAVLRHHLLNSASVVVAQGEPSVVRRVGSVLVVGLLVRVREVGVEERVHGRGRHLGFLPGGLHSEVQPDPVRRLEGHLGVDVVASVVVVDQHSVLVVDSERDIVGVLLGAAAQRKVVSLREGVAEKQAVPVCVHIPQGGDAGVLGGGVALHRGERPDSGPDLADNADDRVDHRVVLQGGGVLVCRELVPEFLLPGKFLGGVHQVQGTLRLDRKGEGVVVADPHLSGFAFLSSHDYDSVRRPRAVDGRRGRVLQDRDALDVIRIDVADAVHEYVVEASGGEFFGGQGRGFALQRHSVNHPERLAASAYVVRSSDSYCGLGAWLAGCRRDGHAGDLSLHQGVHR